MANYYFSTSLGNDGNAGTQAAPFKSINKFNSIAASSGGILNPGDSVFFRCGEEYPGAMTFGRNGSNGNPINIGSWDSGSQPVISGFTTVSGWTVLSGSIYETTVSAAQSSVNMVLLNGNFQRIGKFPKLGAAAQGEWNTFGSHTANSITSNQALGPNFVGGELVKRDCHWIIMRHPITGQSGNTITYTGGNYNRIDDGNGYFFQNHVNACTVNGDWMFESSTKKLRMFFSGGPGSNVVKVATVQNLVTLTSRTDISFTNIRFQGANNYIVNPQGGTRLKFTDCNLEYAGVDGINANSSTSVITLLRTNITRSNNNHIRSNNASDWNIQDCNLLDNGMIAGMGGSGDGTYFATSDIGNNSLVQYNTITNSGYVGINYNGSAAAGNNIRILNNLINGFCLVKDDGAGIYTGDVNGYNSHTQCQIRNNIVLNGIGAVAGAGNDPIYGQTSGIYMDDYSINTIIDGNTLYNCDASGIYLHLCKDLTITNNTTFSNQNQEIRIVSEENPSAPIRNLTITDNIFFNMTHETSQQFFVMVIRAGTEHVNAAWGTWDRNYYCRPLIQEQQAIIAIQGAPNFVGTLAGWKGHQGVAPKDANSKVTPVVLTSGDANKVRFEYNATKSPVVKSLGANYVDVRGTNYNGSITLQPYTSAVLIQTAGTVNNPPTANAGSDKNISLPTNTVTLSGAGTDSDGTITTYLWTKIAGPSTFTIASPNAATTAINNLVQGTYQFQLTVTDNAGATATDVTIVTVNAAPPVNQPPTANAGSDKTMTLPTNSVTQVGSGSDTDGTISTYAWTKTGGPATFTISAPSSATTNFTNLVAGTYQFTLTVTDDDGATNSDVVNIQVNQAPNQIPTANAGSDKTITLPINSVSLAGSGSDVDGTIASYTWTKIAGPSTFTINSPSSATTTVSNLVQGVYTFQLVVTDDDGANSVADPVNVTVLQAVNQLPTADAGANKVITLPTNSTSLAGSGTDPDGTISTYAWTKTAGPSQFTINSPAAATTTVSNLVQGSYTFQLQVTDNRGGTATDTVTVTVNPAPNAAPIANAGPNQTITLPTNTATLSGSGTDSDGTIASYAWTKVAGSPSGGAINSSSSASTGVTGLIQGTYTYQLIVTDNLGLASLADTMILTVNQAVNVLPVANAGSDQTITQPANSATLVGSGTDSDGTIASYSWTKTAGPSTFVIQQPSAATTDITGLTTVGTYTFRLIVTDNRGGASPGDLVNITVQAAPPINQIPVANAGSDRNITLPVNSTSLVGAGTDSDGTIASYSWTKTAGPATFNIVSPSASTTTVNNLVAGTYSFQLIVTDDDGAPSLGDLVTVVVNPAPNVPPSANAGADKTITLPINTVTLGGSGTDTDGTISSYAWTKVSGPATFTIVSPASASTVINNLVQGDYVFNLRVTDNQSATGDDQVNVHVLQAVNVNPIANAGSDKTIILPVNSVSLTGSGTDSDGTIASYAWSRVSVVAGTNPVITSPNTASTSITGLTLVGDYTFNLRVTDNRSGTGNDQIVIHVLAAPNQLPTANAGQNLTLTLPTNSVTITGTGTDPDGTIVSYNWTQLSGPNTAVIGSPNTASSTFSGLIQGTYTLHLIVTDNQGGTGSDDVIVTVNPALPPPNQLPTAEAGPNRTITLPISTTTLNGSGTDLDGTITSYKWTKISGPSIYTIQSSTLATTNVNNLQQGVYLFQLVVTDNAGGTGTDTVQVTVNGPLPVNQLPTVTVSPIVITLPTNLVTLTGSATDPDGTISSYKWTQRSGPSTAVLENVPITQVNVKASSLVEGTYIFRLTVTDNQGGTGFADLSVTVNPAVILPGTQQIEAEAYVTKHTSPRVETTTDVGGGQDVAFSVTNSWTNYSVTLPGKGTYRFEFRVAALNAGAKFQLRTKLGSANFYATLKTVTVPQTGGYQVWTTVVKDIVVYGPASAATLNPTLRINSITSVPFNINWFKFTKISSNT